MSKQDLSSMDEKARAKELKKMTRKLQRAEERLVDYERLVDRTQHLLNTRIGEVEAARAELAQSENRFRNLADAAFEAIIIHADCIIMDCNEAALNLYRMSKQQLVGSSFLQRVQGDSQKPEFDWLHEATSKPMEVTHLRLDGSSVPVEVRSRLIEHKGKTGLVTAVRDITTHKEMQARLEHIANSDVLTGVGNRRFFMDVGQREFYRTVRYGSPLSLLMLDVDHFKRINDTYGHDIGDEALKALANICVETLRTSDIFARLGGEEFAAILPGSDLEGALILSERLRQKVEAMVTNTSKGPIKFTVSVGVTQQLESDANIETILNRSDSGLYIAKEGGRNRVVKT